MGCGCKQKTQIFVADDSQINWTDVVEAKNLIDRVISLSVEQVSFLYELHNSIYVKNKQLNTNCSACLKKVKLNILRYYEERKQREG